MKNSSMEPSIKNQKIQAMKSYKRAKIAYNLVLYSLTSIITCFFFSSPFWFPSITINFFSSFPDKLSFCFNAKCFFVVGNLIVFILVGESRLKQSSSSSTSDFYEEYVARSRNSLHKAINGYEKSLNVEEKIHCHEEKKKEIKNSMMMPHGEEKRKGMRSCKSEVWGESGMAKMEKTRVKKEEQFHEVEKIKTGMRNSKSAVWGESGMVKMEKTRVKKEEMGMRSSKSSVWSERERVKMEKGKGKKEEQVNKTSVIEEEKKIGIVCRESEIVESGKGEGKKEEKFTLTNTNDEEKKMGMRSCRSAVWGECENVEREKAKGKMNIGEEKKNMGMRSIKSEIWSESEIVRLGKTHVAKEEDEQQLNMLNKRFEDFIARVNKQRLFEAKVVDHSKG